MVDCVGQPISYAFLITKPLQLMIVLAILEQLPKTSQNVLIIIDAFEGAEGVSTRLPMTLLDNCTVQFFKNESKAFKHIYTQQYSKLFIDSDVGFTRNFTILMLAIRSPKTVLAVYEEGVGTYRQDLYSGIKKSILPWLGCGIYFGGNWHTKELYLYQPEDYQNPTNANKIVIKKEIRDLLREKRESIGLLFDVDVFFNHANRQIHNATKCIIYLSNWHLDKDFVNKIINESCFVIIKPHPHIKNVIPITHGNQCIVATAGIPAEMLIAWAAGRFSSVKVFHHGSSVVRYVNTVNTSFVLI